MTGPRSCTVSLQRTEQGQIFLAAKVGDKDLELLLDTGSPTTCIDAGVAKDLGIVGDKASERQVALGGTVVADITAHSDITIGELLVHHCPIHLTDIKSTRDVMRQVGFHDFQGIVGVDLLSFLRGRLDFDKMALVIRRP